MDHTHVDVLGIIGSKENLVLRRGLHDIVTTLGHRKQLALRAMVVGDNLAELLLREGTIIEHGVLILVEVLQ